MVKTIVYLDEETVRRLRTMSRNRAKPEAELIREALRQFTSGEKPPLPAGLAMFDRGHSDTSSRRKELLKS